ncbi:preprotein translocase subunit SecG [Candidatus Wolfebacteria bacterium]|nr:preprotein translocase subunit SecG [Candidatus Wolfebacteria bacterium]
MILSIIQIIVSIGLIILILLQERSSGTSGIFGGGGEGGVYQRRRGLERLIFIGTAILVIIFTLLSIANIIFSPS